MNEVSSDATPASSTDDPSEPKFCSGSCSDCVPSMLSNFASTVLSLRAFIVSVV